MSEEESVLDKRQEWDFIVAGWPSEVRKADLLLTEMEKSWMICWRWQFSRLLVVASAIVRSMTIHYYLSAE